MWSLAVGSAHAARPKVASVDNGVVLLGGSNQAIAQKLRAIETAYDCAGVRHVASQIETSDK
jgi:osmotically-inducible protein OsmY